MSQESGVLALRMKMGGTVPRSEYSAESHWPLIKEVTGIDTEDLSLRKKAQKEFVKAWDYAFYWKTHVNHKFFERRGGRFTRMGHAEYSESSEGSSDLDHGTAFPFQDPEEVYRLDPFEEYGSFDHSELVEEFEKEHGKLQRTYSDTIVTGGVYITLFSGLIDIFGWDMLLTSMALDPPRFSRLVERYYQWVKQFYEAYADSTIPVIMCHDDLCWTTGPVTHPSWYRENIFPYLKKLIEPLRQAGKVIMFTCDGNWTEFFDDIVACGINTVVMEPSSDMALFAEKYGKSHGFVGNADTRVLLNGTKEEIYREVKRCMDIGKNCPGFIMATGNHIPANTPVENALYYDVVYRHLRKR